MKSSLLHQGILFEFFLNKISNSSMYVVMDMYFIYEMHVDYLAIAHRTELYIGLEAMTPAPFFCFSKNENTWYMWVEF